MTPDPGSDSSLSVQIILIVVLTAINALFAAAEMAFVSLDKGKINEKAINGDKKAKNVLKLLGNSDNFLSTIQVAITLAGFLNSASAATSLANRFMPLLGDIPGASTIAVVIVTIIISYITLVFGELFPKTVALQRSESVALGTAGIILAVQKVMMPFVKLLSLSTNMLKKITPIEFSEEEEKMTRDEFRSYLEQSQKDEAIDIGEFSMLKGVLSLDTKMAKEVMVPRTDTFMIDYDDGNEENIPKLLDIPYSRVPVYFEDKDNIIGIIHVKNLLRESRNRNIDEIDLKDILNEPLFVPETIYIDDLIYELRKTRNQMAVLNDEYGGVVGVVTLEDVVEEIVGDIDDEYDEVYALIEKINDNRYLVDGSTQLSKFNEFFGTSLESSDVDTIAGFFIIEYGNIPRDGDDAFVEYENFLLKANEIESSRISNLIVERIDETQDTTGINLMDEDK
ncbi:MAG: hemolysin family protein [Desemzia incerta]|uniref:Putative hemolysin n=1 Tax=Desemzia incerta TaxID=82801 RepID=A0A1I5V5A0_9LACT|nr:MULTISPECIES: hemolysin family protein [Desemzia]MCI3027811.1 hemolysin family protein [Desemzia sp. C1]SFQ02675.1 putative hemolysin [Desemzia incerta]